MTRPFPGGPSPLVEATAGRTEGPTELRVGIVSAVLTNELRVDVAGGVVSASYLAGYTPVLAHRVLLLKTQDSWIVLDRIIGPGT